MKILIVKTSSLGDIIHTFPVLNYLRKLFPKSQIDWVVEESCSELPHAHPQVDSVFTVNTKKWRKGRRLKGLLAFIKLLRVTRYDYVFDFQGNIKSGFITLFAKSKYKVGFGKNSVSEWPNLLSTSIRFNPPIGQNIRDDYLYLPKQIFQKEASTHHSKVMLFITNEQKTKINDILSHPNLHDQKVVMISPGSKWKNKCVPVKTLVNFLKQYQRERGIRYLFVWGSRDERNKAKELYSHFHKKSLLIDKCSLPVLQNLMARVSMVISMDSLPLHLAGTTDTPTLSFFGASNSTKYQPQGEQHRSYQGACPYNKTFEKRCPILRSCATGACIRDIKTKDLIKVIDNTSTKCKDATI